MLPASVVNAIKNNTAESIFMASSVLLAASILFIPPPAGLSDKGFHTLLLVLYAVSLWVTEAIPPPLTGLAVMVLLSVLGILSFPVSVAGFGDTSIWLLIGVYIISAAMRESGFDRRFALNMLSLARGSTHAVLLMLNLTTTFFVFLLPTSSGRASLLTPICLGIVKGMNLREGSNIAKGIMLSVSFVSLIGSMGIMTGAVSMVYAVSLFDSLIGFKWTYFSWLQALLPGSIISSLLLWPLMLWIFPPESSHLAGGTRYVQEELSKLGRLSIKEYKVIGYVCAMIACWLFEQAVHLSVTQSCLIVSVILMLPGIGVLDWKKAIASIEWGAIFLLGASIAIVEGLKSTHAIEWATYSLFSSLPKLGHIMTSVVLMLLLTVIRLGFPNLLAMVATTLPIIFSLAASMGLNPVWLGLLGVTSTVLGLLLPTQSITHLITYATGYYTIKDIFRAGVYAACLVMSVVLLLAHLYWPLIGIAPF